MELSPSADTVNEITTDELRSYLDSRSQVEYLVVDVRQPEEFEKSHIPGAKLIPVGELANRLGEIPRTANAIFYCSSGGERSQRASEQAVKNGFSRVFKVSGGLDAWTDATISGRPSLKALDLSGGPETALRAAINLEKGAERFYERLSVAMKNTVVGPLLNNLAAAEEGHARELFDILCELGAPPAEEFDEFYESLPGDVLESGESYDAVIEYALDAAKNGPRTLLELALDMEYRAQDLYGALVEVLPKPELKAQLQELVDQEKAHANELLKGIGMAAEAFE
jgi:rubrerythrin/rhodanese-related sulfurtransferase